MALYGIGLVLLGCFLKALYDVTNRKLVGEKTKDDEGKKVQPLAAGSINFLIAGSMLLIITFTLDPPNITDWWSMQSGLIWPLAATSLLNIFILFGSIYSVKFDDASLVVPIQATIPTFVLIPAWLILGEIPGISGYIGIAFLAIGFYFLVVMEFKHTENTYAEVVEGAPKIAKPLLRIFGDYAVPWVAMFTRKGVFIALMVCLVGSISINFDKLAMQRSSKWFAPAFILLFVGVVGACAAFARDEFNGIQKKQLKLILMNACVLTLMLIVFWWAFDFLFAAYVAVLKKFTIVFTMVLAVIMLNEKVRHRIPGVMVMMVGAVCIALDAV